MYGHFGGGWKGHQHGTSSLRTWRKLHLGVDEATLEIVAALMTTNDIADCEVLKGLLDQVAEPIKQVSGDGAYDKWNYYEAIQKRQARAVIPLSERGAYLAAR